MRVPAAANARPGGGKCSTGSALEECRALAHLAVTPLNVTIRGLAHECVDSALCECAPMRAI
jgi:hypothetical protein